MTPAEIQAEWQYRFDEAIALGHSPERAWHEADAWEAGLTDEETAYCNALTN